MSYMYDNTLESQNQSLRKGEIRVFHKRELLVTQSKFNDASHHSSDWYLNLEAFKLILNW